MCRNSDGTRRVPPTMEQPEPKRSRSPFWSLLAMAFIALVVLAAGLVLSIVSGTIGGVIAITAVFAFAAFHYVVWGWWLSTRLHRDEERRAQDDREERDADHQA